MRYACVWMVGMMLGVLSTTAQAQVTSTIRGRVQDAQSAPIAGARVTVTAPATGATREVPTSADGSFLIANLPPAIVDVAVSAPGLTDVARRGLLLEVGQTLVVDIDMSVAGIDESLTVTAGAAAGAAAGTATSRATAAGETPGATGCGGAATSASRRRSSGCRSCSSDKLRVSTSVVASASVVRQRSHQVRRAAVAAALTAARAAARIRSSTAAGGSSRACSR